MFSRRFIRLTLVLGVLLVVALSGCNLPTTSTGNTSQPTAAPQQPTAVPPQPTTAPQQPTQPPTAAPQGQNGGAQPCTLTATQDVPIYSRPSTKAGRFGTLPAGEPIIPSYRTEDGWYGFDPGVAQADNTGIFRMRWVQAGDGIQMTGACDQLPIAPPLPPKTCLIVMEDGATIYQSPDATSAVLGTLNTENYAKALAKQGDWVRLDLSVGYTGLHGTGWIEVKDVYSFRGDCQDLLASQDNNAPPPQPTATPNPSHQGNGNGNGNHNGRNDNAIRIQFAVGATSWQAPVTAPAAYVFGAMKGQSAEILVMQGDQPADVALALAAPNGTPLQTYNVGRPDWRGVLPQNGDYHLSIAAPNGVDGLTLVVTIYPPLSEPTPVVDTGVGFKLAYDGTYFRPEMPGVFSNEVFGLALAYDDFFMNTNLEEAYFVMGLEPYDNADSCLNAPPEGIALQDVIGVWRINGADYRYYTAGEGAAGNIYQADIFRTYVHDRCVTIYLYTHSTNINNYASGQVTPYDEEGVVEQFKRLFFTLRWP